LPTAKKVFSVGTETPVTDLQPPVPGAEVVISVRNISKSFRMYDSPAQRMKELLHPLKKKYHKEFWAVRDISLEISKGTTFGIIGRNGSGKSTLLQVICGILQPTSGEVQISGRISALLELGAGFNRDFTGRENVFMNGAVMGISRDEMTARFDRIADFAEIGNFMDRPVKTYSSGMYVRLAFALAINVDPDILIVDEALSVGDIRFQRKCFAKIEQFRKEGKTILFVSHSLDSVNLLCDTAVLIDNGQLLEQGKPKEITRMYQKMMLGEDPKPLKNRITSGTDDASDEMEKQELSRIKALADERLKNPAAGKKAEIIDYGILDDECKKVTLLETGQKYTVFSRAVVHESLQSLHLGYPIRTVKGLLLFGVNNEGQKIPVRHQERSDILEGRLELTMWLAPGDYFISFRAGVWLGDWEEVYDEVVDMLFKVTSNNVIGSAGLVNLEAKLVISNL
jgi:ABC-type polysaccharide/polyol phosphate transport system ATPase subunit